MPRTSSQEKAVTKRRSLIVTAGAGTGKTTVLVDRYIHLLEQAGSSKKMLALTFTEKAAAEMKERVRSAISVHAGGERHVQELRDDFNWASIYTFHSFCANILRDFPLESGIDPNFVVLDDSGKGAMINEALDELYQSPSESVRRPLVRIAALVGSWRLSEFLVSLYDKRFTSVQLLSKLLDGDAEQRWREASEAQRASAVNDIYADTVLMDALSSLRSLAERYAGDADAGTKYLKMARRFLEAIRPENPLEDVCSAIQEINALKGSRSMGNKNNFDLDDLSRLRGAYSIVRDSLDALDVPNLLKAEDDAYIRYAVGFLRDLHTIFEEFLRATQHIKEHNNSVDFDDMLIAVHRLFKSDAEFVKKNFADRYRYILVDEMQDTDIIQLEIVRALIEASDNRLDKLFVVGDPKQSIYLFRDVDVSLFKETRTFITETLSGEPINLDVNFRSTPEVVNFVNNLFSQLMSASDRPWDFSYDGMSCSEPRINDQGSVELLLLPPEAEGSERKMAEANMVAGHIQEACSNGSRLVYWDGHVKRAVGRKPRFGDVCILLKSRSNLRFYEEALKRAGIPFHVHAGIGFYSSQEVLDAYNILRFLNNKFDDVALYGLLRSPYIGLSDADLFRIFFEGRGPLILRLKEYAGKGPDPYIVGIVDMLDRWSDRGKREPVSEALHRIVSETSIYAIYGGIGGGEQMISNLEKLLHTVMEWQGKGYAGLPDVVRTLGENIRNEMKEGEAQTDLLGKDVVGIMTVHAAKGLEFPIVIVPEVDLRPKGNGDYVVFDREMGMGVKIPDPETMEMRSTASMSKIEKRMKEKEGAERKRLFYVAATRAKDHLILSGKRTERVESLEQASTWMDLLEYGLNISMEDEAKGSKLVKGRNGEDVNIAIRCWNPLGNENGQEVADKKIEVPVWMRAKLASQTGP